jgi:nucleolar complex protein 2
LASDLVARRQIAKYKAKDRKKVEKKQRIAKEAEQEEQVKSIRQKQVDDFVTQAKTAKGKGYEGMSVDDFFSHGFAEDSDDDVGVKAKKAAKSTKAAAPKAKAAVPLPSRIVPIKGANGKVSKVAMDDSDDEDYSDMEFSDDENNDDDAEFYSDTIEDEDEAGYAQLEADGVEADEDEDDLDFDFDEDDEASRYGGFFQNDNGEDFDEDEEGALDPKAHKADLMKLKQQDPELYKYLLKSDPSMLQFDDDEGDEMSDDSDDDAVSRAAKAKQGQGPGKALTIESLTAEKFKALKVKFDRRKYTAKDLLLVIRLFKSAVLVRKKSTIAQNRAAKKGRNISEKKQSNMDMKLIMLVSSPLYHHFLQFALRVIPCALVELLYLNNDIPIPFLQEGSQDKPDSKAPNEGVSWKELSIALSDGDSPLAGKLPTLVGWSKVSQLTRTYFLTVFTLLRGTIESGLVRLILRSVLPAIPLLESVTIKTPLLLKRLFHFWCYTTEVSYESKRKNGSSSNFSSDNVSRIEAFLVLRRLAVCLPHSSHIKEAVMKGIYQNYVQVCKHVTSHTFPTVIFLTNCVTELYGIDGVLAYQLCFIYLRQLATQLRNFLTAPSSKGLRSIYNWQYVNCLRVWAQILSTYAIEPTSALRPLIYPFVQIATTCLTLSAAPAYFPVKITICELLSTLTFKCQIFVPIAPHLLTILRHPGFSKKKHTTATKHHSHLQKELTYKLHISEGLLDSIQYKENVAQRTLDVLVFHLSVIADAVFYPEYSYPVRTAVKQLLTMITVPSIIRDLRALQTAMGETVHTVAEKRGKALFSPRDVITRQVNGLTLMSNSVALNALHQAASGTGTLGQYKPTSLHKLNEKRTAQRESDDDRITRELQEQIEDLGESDASDYDDDDMDDMDDMDEDEEAMEEIAAKNKKRKALSNADDEDDDDDDDDDSSDSDSD